MKSLLKQVWQKKMKVIWIKNCATSDVAQLYIIKYYKR